jgi:hypothetical protein
MGPGLWPILKMILYLKNNLLAQAELLQNLVEQKGLLRERDIGCHDIQHNDIQRNDTQHNYI